MGNTNTATVSAIIHFDIDHVWNALTDPDEIARYMMGTHVETDWKEGSSIVWKGKWKNKAYEDHGRVLKVREPELLEYVHYSGTDTTTGGHHVLIELQEVAGVTHVRLTQNNNPTDKARLEVEKNWTAMFDGLKRSLGEAPVSKPVKARV